MNYQSNRRNSLMIVAMAGMLIAMMFVVQVISFFFLTKTLPLVGQLVTGSLVNLVLIVGAGSVGFLGTAAAAILSPVLAFAFGQMPFPQMLPVIAIGNLVIVAIAWAFFRNGKSAMNIAGITVGAVAKTAFLWAATSWLVIPLFFTGKAMIAKKLALMFSWPQLVTALIGGVLALIILPPVRSFLRHRSL